MINHFTLKQFFYLIISISFLERELRVVNRLRKVLTLKIDIFIFIKIMDRGKFILGGLIEMVFKSKRRSFGAFCVIGIFIALSVIFYACINDFGLEADFFKGTIKGNLIIDRVVPQNTDEIRVALAKDFPPTNFLELIVSGVIPVKMDTSITSQMAPYEFEVPLGKYEAIIAIWKEKNESWSITNMLGLYGNFQFFQPDSIVLTEEDPIADSIDIEIDFSRVIRTAKIEGHIEFIGEWPINTAAVAWVAYEFIPQNKLDFLRIAGFEILPKNIKSWDYRIGVNPGTYKFIAVFWLAEGANLLDFKTLGFYPDHNSPDEPGEVVVNENEPTVDIDIMADFANINK